MEAYKYRLIKEFCDLDVNLDRLEAFLEAKKSEDIDIYKEYPNHIEQKNAMLDYSKALACRLCDEDILTEFTSEVRKSLDIDKDEAERSQEEINKEFSEAVRRSLKEHFGMDAEINIKSFSI